MLDELLSQYAECEKKPVHVFGKDLFVRKMDGLTWDRWERAGLKTLATATERGESDPDNLRARLVLFTLVDSQGKPVLATEEELADWEKVRQLMPKVARLPGRDLADAAKVAIPLNGLDVDEEEAEKNSERTTPDELSSD